MLYTTLTVKDTEYKLRLNARATVEIERKLGTNPLNILMKVEDGLIPNLDSILTIIWGALQAYNHGFKMEDVYNLYDEYVEDGKTLIDLIPIIAEIFKTSGLFNDKVKETEEKN